MRRLLVLALFLLPALPAGAQAPAAAPFAFVAWGDIPYCQAWAPQDCPAEEGRVARLMGQVNETRPAFAIHVGDATGGSETCSDEKLLRAFTFFGLANHPVVYTPGDNEWTDCWQDRAGRYDPVERLGFLRSRYFRDAVSLGRGRMPLTRQADEQPAHPQMVENMRWQRNGVFFLTIHLPGSNNGRPGIPGDRPQIQQAPGALAEFEARDAANVAWLQAGFDEARRADAPAVVVALQADLFYVARCGSGYDSGYARFRAALGEAAAAFRKPVLLIHGDSHFWLHDRPVAAAPNLTRIMVPGDRDVRAVRVEVDPAAADPWRFSLIGEADRPARGGCPG